MTETIESPQISPAPLPKPAAPTYAMLDSWRGIAALMVVVFHGTADFRSQMHPPEDSFSGAVILLMNHLFLGVQMFFVISGYCIAAAADSARRKPNRVWEFSRRRLNRIFPPYLVWFAIVATIAGLAEKLTPTAGVWQSKSSFVPVSTMSPLAWFSNITLTHTWLPQFFGEDGIDLTRVSWTLCYEIQFYFVAGLLMGLFPRSFFRACAVVTVALIGVFAVDVASGLREPFRGTFLDGRWLQFAMGIGGYWVINYCGKKWQWGYAAGLITIAVLCWHLRELLPSRAVTDQKNFLELTVCTSFASALVLLKLIDLKLATRKWALLLSKCGVISYSLYLIHWPFCKAISLALVRLGFKATWAAGGVAAVISVAVSVAAATIYFGIVERRFIKLPSRDKSAVDSCGPRTPVEGISTTS